MKLNYLITLILAGAAFIAGNAKAQSTSPIHVGIKGGGSLSNLKVSNGNLDSKYALGYHGGVFTRFDISRMYVQGELLYSQKQSKINGGDAGAGKTKWNSVEVPVLVGFKLIQSEKANFRIFGGGVYSYIVNDKATVLKQVSSSFKNFDRSNIGYQAGVGVDIGRLTMDLKYEGALTKISKDFNARPNSLQASVGFMIF